jgi:hypothetical protein
MLAHTGLIPTGRGWMFEPKLDGFRFPLARAAASALHGAVAI